METISYSKNWVDIALWIWFALTAVSVALDERGNGGNDSGDDYPDDLRYAGDGAEKREILGHYVARLLSRRGSGLSGQFVASR